MAYTVRRIDYFYIMVRASPGIGYEALSALAEQSVNLVAITAIPFGPARTQLTVFPDDTAKMQRAAEQANIPLDGPHPALVVQGDDEVGALAHIHEKLLNANVHVFRLHWGGGWERRLRLRDLRPPRGVRAGRCDVGRLTVRTVLWIPSSHFRQRHSSPSQERGFMPEIMGDT